MEAQSWPQFKRRTSLLSAWGRVANAASYDVYLVQSPWAWADIKYSKTGLSSSKSSYTFSGVEDGDYRAFVISRPNGNKVQSNWVKVTVKDMPPEIPEVTVNEATALVGDTVTFSWEAVSRATSYLYYLCPYPHGYAYTDSVRMGTVTTTSISFDDLPSGKYFMMVRSASDSMRSAMSNIVAADIYEDDYIPIKTAAYNGHIYSVYDNVTQWTFARDLCTGLGGHLATVEDAAEQAFLTELIGNGSCLRYWLGGCNLVDSSLYNSDGPWYWVTGETFSYTNWKEDEPSFSGENYSREHYLEIQKNSTGN